MLPSALMLRCSIRFTNDVRYTPVRAYHKSSIRSHSHARPLLSSEPHLLLLTLPPIKRITSIIRRLLHLRLAKWRRREHLRLRLHARLRVKERVRAMTEGRLTGRLSQRLLLERLRLLLERRRR